MTRAILSLRPGSEFVYSDNDYSTIEWIVLEGTAPTAKAVKDEMARLEKAEADAEANREALRASRVAKLLALGLTEEEINA